jgi:hypothetical protein
MPWLLYPRGKSSSYPLDRRLGGPQICSGHSHEEKNSQPPLEIKPWNPDHPAYSPVAKPTELYVQHKKREMIMHRRI